jgi:probable rRNA maturation factor
MAASDTPNSGRRDGRPGERGSCAYEVEIANRHGGLPVDEGLLCRAARRVLAAEGVESASISLVLTDDAEIQQINREFLGHDDPTDVISFPLTPPDAAPPLEGELIVSLETAQRVARGQGWSLEAEVVLYVVHGMLHLCGYDDQTDVARSMMRRREREILSELHLPESASAGWEDPHS